MAEAAGLAIGIAALVGTFKDCIDVYGMIVAARSITDDAEILNTKLDVERMLLLQWADRVGLVEPQSYDRRLDDPDLNSTIIRVLESIKRLLSDGKALRDRYGLVDYQGISHSIVLDDRSETTAGSTRLQAFIIRFNKLSLHTREPQSDQSFATRFKWVVRDREKFISLLSELSYFISRLNALIPPAGAEPSLRTMTEQDLAQIPSIPQLKAIAKASIGFKSQIALIARQTIRSLNQGRILDRLWFRWMDDRKANIADRHFRTLDWALDPPDGQLKWDNLAEWLKTGSGVYWLAGKPGSGKSTLMKYLSDHPKATSLLKKWAGQSELVMSQFFFYGLGQTEQKSQEGILRSLLFQSLEKHRDLIELVLPMMWKEAIITEDKDDDLTMPSLAEMQDCLLRLAETVSSERKFCVLIDGLDEFEGKHKTITTFLARLERLPNFKSIVSSRPLSVFVNAFEHAPKMYLQDLTEKDIEAYIHDTILDHRRMAQTAQIERDLPVKIAKILVDKALGVFLWVVLACRSIIEGLEDYETVPELMNRITELPSELDAFFRRIIAGVDVRKRDQCARLLRLVFESHKVAELEHKYLPAMGLAVIDEQGLRADYTGPSVTDINNEQLLLRLRMLEGRLRSRCCGLIELQGQSVLGGHFGSCRVEFMHRSLYDFLCTEGVWNWDVLHVDDGCGEFEPHLILASLWAQLAGITAFGGAGFKRTCIEKALIHNAQARENQCSPRLLATSLSRLEGVFIGCDAEFGRFRGHADSYLPHRLGCQENYDNLSLVLALAAEMGMVGLIQLALEEPDEVRRSLVPQHLHGCSTDCLKKVYKLTKDRVESDTHIPTFFPLLHHATCQPFLKDFRKNPYRRVLGEGIIMTTEAVEYLLKAGHDPNEKFAIDEDCPSTTPWAEWLLRAQSNWPRFTQRVEWRYQQPLITLLLVDAGARIGAPETKRCNSVDWALRKYISKAAERRGQLSVEQARSDALWLKVRDRIQSLRSAASTQDAHHDSG